LVDTAQSLSEISLHSCHNIQEIGLGFLVATLKRKCRLLPVLNHPHYRPAVTAFDILSSAVMPRLEFPCWQQQLVCKWEKWEMWGRC